MKNPKISEIQAIGWEFMGAALLAALYLASFGVRHSSPHEGPNEQTRLGPLIVGVGFVGLLYLIVRFPGSLSRSFEVEVFCLLPRSPLGANLLTVIIVLVCNV